MKTGDSEAASRKRAWKRLGVSFLVLVCSVALSAALPTGGARRIYLDAPLIALIILSVFATAIHGAYALLVYPPMTWKWWIASQPDNEPRQRGHRAARKKSRRKRETAVGSKFGPFEGDNISD